MSGVNSGTSEVILLEETEEEETDTNNLTTPKRV